MKRAGRVFEHHAGSHHNSLPKKGPVMASLDSRRTQGATSRPLDIDREVLQMRAMSVDQLRKRFAEVFRESTHSRHKEWLIKRIAWRMQAHAEGGLSERAYRRAIELAKDADLRTTMPRQSQPAPDAAERTVTQPATIQPGTTLLPGTGLVRQYKGKAIRVTVLADGFEFEGERYKSLTAIAEVVTGKHWNGFHFFGLRPKGGQR
jgi:hypothetical protein